MFYNCYSLESLQLDNFNTLKVENMQGIFYNYSSLISLNLDSFDTINDINMEYMFKDCKKLQSLEIINFVSNTILTMTQMFYNCISLISLDLYNFNIEKLKLYSYSPNLAFESINPNIIYCINISRVEDTLQSLSTGTFDCPYLCIKKGRKYIQFIPFINSNIIIIVIENAKLASLLIILIINALIASFQDII